MTAPEQSTTPTGPEELNQHSGVVTYQIAIQDFTDEYLWKLKPESAGIMNSENNTASFELSENYEGDFYVTVQLKNLCGVGMESDSLAGKAVIITGLKEIFDGNEIDIYPNPTQNQLYISFNQFEFINSIRIIDLNGKEVWSTHSVQSKVKDEIRLSLQKGVYTILIETKDEMISERLFIK